MKPQQNRALKSSALLRDATEQNVIIGKRIDNSILPKFEQSKLLTDLFTLDIEFSNINGLDFEFLN